MGQLERIFPMLTLRRVIGLAVMPSTCMAAASCFILSRPPIFQPQKVFAISGQGNMLSPFRRIAGLSVSMSSSAGDSVVSGMERKIREALNPIECEVIPAYGDPNGSHVTIKVVSSAFEGKRAVQRQQMVYKIIWDEMQGAVHAVDQMIVKTPAEVGK